MKAQIAISRLHFPVTKLGPGCRVGIWFQGCSIRCPGCISMDTWRWDRGWTHVDEVVEAVAPWLADADGITISGGEPFDQAAALAELLARLRALSKTDILVFTGHSLEAVGSHLSLMDGMIDALVTDPFELAAPQTLALRGSNNQRLHLLTPLGRERFASCDRAVDAGDRAVDVMFDENGDVWLAGIPARGDLGRLQRILLAEGARLSISEDPRAKRTGSVVPPG
ncbi:MAG: 4Fe-4S cluster-binding domain-containing protein [Hyphomicrobiales bacterium]|nr:4Fe-4S cluster-binding domain-containing protein [Hyphomicrobiales bacterium]